MKTICVLEYREQFETIKRSYPIWKKSLHFICASEETEELLSKENVPFDLLDDKFLINEWDQINEWARKASLHWFLDAPFQDKLTLKGVPLGQAYDWRVAYGLVHQLKIQRLIDHLLDSKSFDDAIVLETLERKGWRWKLDCRSFNYILARRLREKGIPFQVVRCRVSPRQRPLWKEGMRRILAFFLARFPPSWKSSCLFAAGTIKDLAPLLAGIAGQMSASFIDDSLQFTAMRICRKEGIKYVLLNSLLSIKDRVGLRRGLRHLDRELQVLLPALENSRWFRYQNKPIVGVGEALTEVFRRDRHRRYQWSLICEKMIQAKNPQTLLLHEDRDLFRATALTARREGLRVVVLSHGIPPVNYDWRGRVPNTLVAETIVNSEFESDKYLQMGGSIEQLHVLGLPRFDRIYHRVQSSQKGPLPSKPTILYCPHRLLPLNRKKGYFLGIHTPGRVTKENSRAVIQAVQEVGCHLWIKLHDNSDSLLWKEFATSFEGSEIELFPPHTNILDLLERCDLVVTTFSTVVIEAMLFDREVITLNFTGRKDLHPYAEYGIALGVRDPLKLAQVIRDCLYNEKTRLQLRESRRRYFEYFGGHFDGKNTERVIQFILNPNWSQRTEMQLGAFS